jgi:hypothetical protein
MSKTFTESNSLPPQKRVFKIKAFKPIASGQALESNLSLGETLKQNREIKERIDKERADALQAMIDTGDYEKIGRKVMMLAFDYMERFAKDAAENEIND